MRFPEPPQENLAALYIEDTDAPLAGLVESTRYAYFKTVARGGKCIIQSCKDLRLSRVVCHKSLRPELSENPVERKRFLREARVTAMLVHPNTVPVYDLGKDRKGRLYFTMKFVFGYTFREVLDYRERYDLMQLVGVLIQVAQALAYAHSHGVIHRDLKPENILVGPYGEVLLLDWGLAKVRPRNPETNVEDTIDLLHPFTQPPEKTLTDHDRLQGTPSYMSPEQIERDRDIDGRTDLFSLGTILYEVLTGKLPFDADSVEDILRAITKSEAPPPSSRTDLAVPKLLEEVCMRCLEGDKTRRPRTADQLIRELSEDWSAELRR